MDLQQINVGVVANDGTGDSPRAAWLKQVANNRLLAAGVAAASDGAAAALAQAQALAAGIQIDTPIAVDDADCLVLDGVTLVALVRITAARSLILPSAALYPARRAFVVVDESGGLSAATPWIVRRRGNDSIAGQTEIGLVVPFQVLTFRSNGSNLWTFV